VRLFGDICGCGDGLSFRPCGCRAAGDGASTRTACYAVTLMGMLLWSSNTSRFCSTVYSWRACPVLLFFCLLVDHLCKRLSLINLYWPDRLGYLIYLKREKTKAFFLDSCIFHSTRTRLQASKHMEIIKRKRIRSMTRRRPKKPPKRNRTTAIHHLHRRRVCAIAAVAFRAEVEARQRQSHYRWACRPGILPTLVNSRICRSSPAPSRGHVKSAAFKPPPSSWNTLLLSSPIYAAPHEPHTSDGEDADATR
jgi:hypothetical protein